MSIQSDIEAKLNTAFSPLHVQVINESANHNVPPGSESHFKVIIVSERFANQSLLNRHRMVNDTLKDELQGKIHALALHTYTQADWNAHNSVTPASPPCLGGSKAK